MTLATMLDLEARGFDNCRNEGHKVHVGCTRCQAAVINGTPCHESGCPNQMHECKGCDAFVPRGVRCCEDCS